MTSARIGVAIYTACVVTLMLLILLEGWHL